MVELRFPFPPLAYIRTASAVVLLLILVWQQKPLTTGLQRGQERGLGDNSSQHCGKDFKVEADCCQHTSLYISGSGDFLEILPNPRQHLGHHEHGPFKPGTVERCGEIKEGRAKEK